MWRDRDREKQRDTETFREREGDTERLEQSGREAENNDCIVLTVYYHVTYFNRFPACLSNFLNKKFGEGWLEQ